MITSALRQKMQGAGKIAKQIFMVVVPWHCTLMMPFCDNRKQQAQAQNARTQRYLKTLPLMGATRLASGKEVVII